MGQTHQREEAIFDAAMELPPGQRAAHLDHACGGDAALRQRMESLLKSCESACEFLDSPTDPAAAQTISVLPDSFEKAGDRIGRYKLLQQIGEGGCGVVYMAEQEEPVSRRVALKVIKLGLDTKSVIARFEAERQALALMDHPNIAKVLDAGATETGRPYFVMELVRGLKITEYCDEARLSTNARLDLFIQVCQAIQHAHQKGIIHRDIKPSNILVTINDGVPVPKVIDFGIAKATGGLKLTNKTVFTAFEQFIGTPAYMSPEQAVLTSLDIDTRSDIYALGVLLYELLTGKTPFDAQELLAIGLDEMRRTIREQEPQRPSTRISTLAQNELSTTAQRRGIEAPKLVSELRGDLDWIVMKALEKDRGRRYETANGLAMDIQRHLDNEPVVACPPSRAYRLQKMVRRNKLAFTAAAVVVAALVIGLGISTWLFLKEREARTRAVAAEQAERKLRQEAELRELKLATFVAVTDWETAVPAVRKAIEAQRRLLGNDHPDVADSLEHLGSILGQKKNFSEAEKAAREALAIRRKKSPDGDLKVAGSLQLFARILFDQGKWAEVEPLIREAVKIRRRLQGDESAETATAINNLAVSLDRQNKTAEALPLFMEAIATSRKLLPDGDPDLARSAFNLIRSLIDAGRLSEAADRARDFVPRNYKVEPALTEQVSRLADKLISQGRSQEAEQMLNDLVSKASDSREILRVRADYRAQHGRWKDATADFAQVTQPKSEEKDDVEDWHKLAPLLVQSGDLAGYREHCRKSVERFGHTGDPHTAHLISKDCLILPDSGVDLKIVDRMADASVAGEVKWGGHSSTKALAEYRQGRFASAADWAEKTLAHPTSDSSGWRSVQTSTTLAMARHRLNQSELAQAALTSAQDIANKKLPKLDSADLGTSWLDVIIAHALLREAQALIEGVPETKAETR